MLLGVVLAVALSPAISSRSSNVIFVAILGVACVVGVVWEVKS